MNIIRNKCCICDGNLDSIITFEKYPISFSMTDNENYKFEDLIFTECIKCKTIQIKNLIDLEILYDKPHNHNIIGKTWIEHFQEFSYMINKFKKYNDNVLEIGSPTDKIEKNIDNYLNWILMDPNSEKYPQTNIKSVNEFFSEKSKFNCKFDTIIHSHLLEHLYDPKNMLLKMSEVLTDDGNIFISIPNLHSYAFEILFLGMHFEHTYLINEINMLYLCNYCKLEIVNKQYYKKHSIFYQLKKTKQPHHMQLSLLNEFNLGYKLLLLNKINEMKDMICNINIMINNDNKNTYIFGCHSNTQSMLYFGLNSENIKCILDNDSTKWNKKLYGYDLLCNSPETIKDEQNVIIICNIGSYTYEVKKQLIEINNCVVFI
jgi:hypothetical protein